MGTDGAPPPGRRALVNVLVPEMYRGLKFAGAAIADGGGGGGGDGDGVARVQTFLADASGRTVAGYLAAADPSLAAAAARTGSSRAHLLAAALTASPLYYAARGAPVARLAGATADALPAPSVARGRAVHDVGPAMRALREAFLDPVARGAVDCHGSMADRM
jgi:hypothetical protein